MINMKNNQVIIAILDTGISNQFSDIIFDGYEMTKTDKDEFIISHNIGNDLHGHGTAVSNIIYLAESNLKIISFKICNYDNEVNSKALTKALTYIYDNLNVDIINISAGVTYIEDYFEMKNICKKLYDKGIVIISAFDNEGAVSYPAAFSEVVGIDCSLGYKTDIIVVTNSIVNVIIPPKYYRTYWNDGKKALLRGTSFACAYFCGMYGKYLFNGGERDVHHYIQTFSKRIIECNHTKEISGPVFKIKKAIIFPVNKEAHAILRMKAELEFSIVGAFDDKLSGNVGKDFWGIIVQPFDLIDWDDDFDTVILSCIVDFERIIGKNYTKMIIDNCKKHSKQLYTFENIIADFRNDEDALNMSKYSKIYYPEVNSSMTPYYKFNKLNRLSIPVLGVFGTAPKQGKFTLQLGLLKSLKKECIK